MQVINKLIRCQRRQDYNYDNIYKTFYFLNIDPDDCYTL